MPIIFKNNQFLRYYKERQLFKLLNIVLISKTFIIKLWPANKKSISYEEEIT
jgi:hypothetical protein